MEPTFHKKANLRDKSKNQTPPFPAVHFSNAYPPQSWRKNGIIQKYNVYFNVIAIENIT